MYVKVLFAIRKEITGQGVLKSPTLDSPPRMSSSTHSPYAPPLLSPSLPLNHPGFPPKFSGAVQLLSLHPESHPSLPQAQPSLIHHCHIPQRAFI